MTTLTVWKFDSPAGAQEALNKLVELSKQHLIQVNDAAVVSWEAGKKKPKTNNYGSMTGQAAVSGAYGRRRALPQELRYDTSYSDDPAGDERQLL